MALSRIVHCLLPPTAVQAGETLKGNVVIQTRGMARGDVLLFLHGKERTCVRSRSSLVGGSDTASSRKTRRTEDQRQFFYVQSKLSSGRIHRGTKKYPFSIAMPASLPATMSSGTGNAGFQIEYKLKVQLKRIVKEFAIVVQSVPLPDVRVPCMIEPTCIPVKGVFFRKGTVTLGASIEDTHVGRGQQLELHLACHNDSTAEIQRVQIKLYEEMQWKAHGIEEKTSTKLLSLQNVDLPGLGKHRKDWDEIRRSQSDPTSHQAIYAAIYEELKSGRNKISLSIPTTTRDTYQGQLITISHSIKIKLHTAMLTSNPERLIPIRIGAPPVRRQQQEQPCNIDSSAQTTVQTVRPLAIPASIPALVSSSDSEPDIEVAPSQDFVPIAPAIMLSDVTHVEEEVIVLGGDAVLIESSEDLSSLSPLPPPSETEVTLNGLLRAMTLSVNEYDFINNRLRDTAWLGFFRSLSPDDYGAIIRRVRVQFDESQVAELLAPYLNGGDCFTCCYAAAAVRNASEWNRPNVVERLVPRCVDIVSEHGLIRQELNEWEQTITSTMFENAIESVLYEATSRETMQFESKIERQRLGR